MRAAVLTDRPYELELADIPAPVPGPGEVVLDVTASGICGSDFTIAKGLAPAGTIMGHEIAGTVAADPSGRWQLGDRVAVRPFFGCGACGQCERGRHDHCVDFALAGVRRPGGFAQQVIARADELFAIPSAISVDDGALVEPLAIAMHAWRRVQAVPGDRVVVTGAGPIGLAAITWARALGIDDITVSEPDAGRRALAEHFGATAAVSPDALDEAVAGAAPDVVLECSGRVGVIDDCLRVAGVEARVGVVGLCAAQDHFMPVVALQKEVDLRFCMFYDQVDFTDTLDAMDTHRLRVDGFVTEVIGLDDLPARFAELAASPDGGKVVVRP